MGNLCCIRGHSVQFFVQLFYTVKLHSLTYGSCTHTGFLPEWDSALVKLTTAITAAGGQFDFERCTRKMFVHRNKKLTYCRFHTD
jgi:hypothetical protein